MEPRLQQSGLSLQGSEEVSAMRILPVLLNIDGSEKRIDFRTVPSIQQEMLLGTDFCDVFRLSLQQAEGLWREYHTEHWYRFTSEKMGTEPVLEI